MYIGSKVDPVDDDDCRCGGPKLNPLLSRIIAGGGGGGNTKLPSLVYGGALASVSISVSVSSQPSIASPVFWTDVGSGDSRGALRVVLARFRRGLLQ